MDLYIPQRLPIGSLDKSALFTAVGEANAALARFDGLLMGLSDPMVMLSPLANEEAVLSSKIEGREATMEEVLRFEAGQGKQTARKIRDIESVINYRKALIRAKKIMAEQSGWLDRTCELHRVLMDGVLGREDELGRFRDEQCWIGAPDSSIEEAIFVPPDPLDLLDHLQAWESYMESEDIDPVIQAAMIHAQFELIHPFTHGNGRIGRLLIPLFLHSKGSISVPAFYLSGYFERHRDEYYARLLAISQHGDWNGWCNFFLCAVAAQAKQNSATICEIVRLYAMIKEQVHEITHSAHCTNMTDALFEVPIFTASGIARRARAPIMTIHKLIKAMLERGTLQTLRKSAGRSPAILGLAELMNMVERRQPAIMKIQAQNTIIPPLPFPVLPASSGLPMRL